ncbi:tetratricopeptide repeat protein [Photobacterium galatheae]|uniref:Tetratrico peptide repeat group 5 domain-containing protein n=1 Tax=Photobacterium galatheae TaxID=1654360 RepID=A0A066RN06_9GAMM|nr:tetratricopeptide repeat protein [Photobacterium galatheae]KDM91709.1 hypothetical protein EA58_10085 [Photobacterium galatheae]MCM0149820.1 tetratricopeptide repeat protein [Photobacterium galatheae]
MHSIIENAIELRKSGQYEASRKLLFSLLSNHEYQAKACLQIAWAYDNEGKEQEAITYYESALTGPLSTTERFDAIFGLACTLRSLGRYNDALTYFEQTISEYPDAIEVMPFYAMCLYNVGQHQDAISLLLELLVSTTNSDSIKNYQRAILLYSKDLDRQW